MGVGMSGGGACGPHKLAPRHQGVGGGGKACGPLVRPRGQLPGLEIFKKFRKKSYLIFMMFGELLFSGYFSTGR